MYSFVFRDLQFLLFLQSSMIACDCRKSKTLRIIYWVASRDKFLLSRPSRRFDRFWETFAISRWTWKSNQGWARLAWGSFRESPPFETRLKREPSWTKEETWWNFKNMKVTFLGKVDWITNSTTNEAAADWHGTLLSWDCRKISCTCIPSRQNFRLIFIYGTLNKPLAFSLPFKKLCWILDFCFFFFHFEILYILT